MGGNDFASFGLNAFRPIAEQNRIPCSPNGIWLNAEDSLIQRCHRFVAGVSLVARALCLSPGQQNGGSNAVNREPCMRDAPTQKNSIETLQQLLGAITSW